MPKSILIVDDNAAIRKNLRVLLEQDNEEWAICGEAVNGRDALEKAQQLHPDLMVVDFAMPVMNGFEVASAMQKASSHVPMILFTAYKDRLMERQAMDRGFSAVISKEDDSRRLIQSARLLLGMETEDTAWARSENLETELSAIEHMDWEYYCNPARRRADVSAYMGRQRRRRELLGELALRSGHEPVKNAAEAHPARRAADTDTEVTVYSDRGGVLPGRATDVSATGFSAVLPIELSPGEMVKVEINLSMEIKVAQAVVRSRSAFRHDFEFLPDSPTRMMRYSDFS